jgi:hypothetical protein
MKVLHAVQIEGSNAKRRMLDGVTLSVVVRGLRPGHLVKGILVKARNDFGWCVPCFE